MPAALVDLGFDRRMMESLRALSSSEAARAAAAAWIAAYDAARARGLDEVEAHACACGAWSPAASVQAG